MITVLARPCPSHPAVSLISIDGHTVCWTCDGVDLWPMCQPEEPLIPMPRWRKVLVFWALVVGCWLPVVAAVRWWRS